MNFRIWALILGLTTLVFAGFAISHQPKHDPWACVFDDAACSTAVWTYALFLVGLLALIAAIEAGTFAKDAAKAAQSTLALERAPVAAISRCDERTACKGRDSMAFWLEQQSGPMHENDPNSGANYRTAEFDVVNIGRSAMGRIELTLKCSGDGKDKLYQLALRSLAAEGRLHVILNVREEIAESVALKWESATAELPVLDDEKPGERKISIYPDKNLIKLTKKDSPTAAQAPTTPTSDPRPPEAPIPPASTS